MRQPKWSRISRRKSERRKSPLKSWLKVEALEDRAMPSQSQWVAVFNNLAPAETLEQQTTSATTLLSSFGVTEDEVRVLAALDLSGSYLVETADTVTQSELNAQLGTVAGYVYSVSFAEADPSTLRKIQPQRARSEALFGPFDYDTFLSREKNGEFPDHSGTPDPDPFNVLTNNNTGATGTGRFTQSETTIVAFGNNVVVGFNDSGSNSGGTNKFTGFAHSTDGGDTFTDGGTLPTNAVGDAGDPVLARNNTTGRIYFSTLGFSGAGTIQMFRSDDNGVDLDAAGQRHAGRQSEDKQWHTVDNFPGAGNGNVYMVSRRFGAVARHLLLPLDRSWSDLRPHRRHAHHRGRAGRVRRRRPRPLDLRLLVCRHDHPDAQVHRLWCDLRRAHHGRRRASSAAPTATSG